MPKWQNIDMSGKLASSWRGFQSSRNNFFKLFKWCLIYSFKFSCICTPPSDHIHSSLAHSNTCQKPPVHLLPDSWPPLFLIITIMDNSPSPINNDHMCMDVGACPWDMDNLSLATSPKKNYSPSLSSHQQPIDLLLGVGPLELLPHPWNKWLLSQDLHKFYKFLNECNLMGNRGKPWQDIARNKICKWTMMSERLFIHPHQSSWECRKHSWNVM